jgi:hypothetical protein
LLALAAGALAGAALACSFGAAALACSFGALFGCSFGFSAALACSFGAAAFGGACLGAAAFGDSSLSFGFSAFLFPPLLLLFDLLALFGLITQY